MKLTGRTAQRTLAWVNRIRVEYGRGPIKKLPKGDRWEPGSCPIACALHARSVTGATIQLENGLALDPPKYVNQFIIAFDEGRIPELVA